MEFKSKSKRLQLQKAFESLQRGKEIMADKIVCDICGEEMYHKHGIEFHEGNIINESWDLCDYHLGAIDKFIKILRKTEKKMRGAKNG